MKEVAPAKESDESAAFLDFIKNNVKFCNAKSTIDHEAFMVQGIHVKLVCDKADSHYWIRIGNTYQSIDLGTDPEEAMEAFNCMIQSIEEGRIKLNYGGDEPIGPERFDHRPFAIEDTRDRLFALEDIPGRKFS